MRMRHFSPCFLEAVVKVLVVRKAQHFHEELLKKNPTMTSNDSLRVIALYFAEVIPNGLVS